MPSTRLLPWTMTAGGVGAIVAAFLPWITVSNGTRACSMSSMGIAIPHGAFAVILGLAVLTVGSLLAAGRRVDPVVTIVPPALLAIFMILELIRAIDRILTLTTASFALCMQYRLGSGLWLLVASSLVTITVAIVLLQMRRRATARGRA